ncbi:AfsR/SARP family transcriptional regulator [Mumia zhuanghuii]|uniref:SARP family transcriptional regulator n=1 Tax=Mumia zhuanghuii TaxID=2585211 RepID=A0A5C4MHV9_9ACTN|nr:BTAD domain-containing putative transcriptional regulator [Mumia zhuanghuii]TNC42440.1 SARP family transcriptional regulator [Mumia zhuanghuii]TNC43714.1 SARP family transcriptional regulator [Mumia zhuanghuii]
MVSASLDPRLQVLGDFEMRLGDEVLRLSGPAQRLLAMLAVRHRERPARRTALAETLWPDTSPKRASSNLRSVLWRLPRSRGRALVTGTATGVRLWAGVRVDLWEAEAQARHLCRADTPPPTSVHAIDALTRDLLPGWEEEWITVDQESFRQQRLHALERCASALREDGRYLDALATALGAVQAEPLRETAHRRVIEVHLDEGNQAEALRQYDSYRRLLAAELGISPSPEIRRLVAPLLGRPIDPVRRG